jgi:transcriptional regulator with GAF, ATPase, and Fis domain
MMNFALGTELSPEKTLDIVLESIGELVDYELAVVLGYEGQGRLVVRKTRGKLASPRLDTYSISLEKRPDLAKLLDAGVPKLFAPEERHIDTYAEVLDLPERHSCLFSPLSVDGKLIGLLTLDHRSCGAFSVEILRFIDAISRLIALALVQAESSRELSERAAALAAERNRLLDLDSDAFRSLIGASPAWERVLDSIRLVAATDSPVLLLGETGTGKEEAARALHRLSSRAPGPFVAVNCSALPAALAESELFGHEKGSFTGAQALRRGRFELADGGTLFLDEIGELPPEVQPKLLRALQEGRFERVGGERAVEARVRVVAATHVDLELAVAEGRFREDLYYRLAVFPLRLPPLRERGPDILLLAEHFAARLRARSGWEELSFEAGALEALGARDWPGNVRELRNVVERAAILARGGAIGTAQVEEAVGLGRAGRAAAPRGDGEDSARVRAGAGALPAAGGGRRGAATLEDALRARIVEALAESGGRVYGRGGAAELLGLKPSTLQSKMKRLGIARGAFASGQ